MNYEWGQVLLVKRESNCMWTLSLLFLDKTLISTLQAFPGRTVVKHLPTNARVSRDTGLIPGRERSPEKETAACSIVLARGTSWTEEPGVLQAVGSQRVRHG